LPYLGAVSANDPVYRLTRARILSPLNPYYASGRAGAGIGSPHVARDRIWPMSLVMQAMTSDDDAEILGCLRLLVRSHARTGFLHETFHQDAVGDFTRPWFSWVNTLFGELILKVLATRPHVLTRTLEH
jgi:meiotically up-regulated gene 157 (Mug157) protein